MIYPAKETMLEVDKARKTFLPFALPDLDETELEGIKEALDSGWVTTGPKTKKFEAEFAEVVGAKHAIAVNSCTAGMHLALEAIGLQRGDEVITTPYTFAATAEVIRYFDATPVFVDVEPSSLNLNPNLLESAISPRTKAIIPVHIGGFPAEMDAIHEVAQRKGIRIIEDAAHADPLVLRKWNGMEPNSKNQIEAVFSQGALLDSSLKSRSSGIPNSNGMRSAATCFSFYATKPITTGEGGMICTDSDAIADRCRIMALHGISKDAWNRYTADGSWFYEIIAPGHKYNMPDIAAAMGLAQLRKAERMLRRRTEIAEMYNKAFGGNPMLQIPVGEVRSQTSARQPKWILRRPEVRGQTSEVRRQKSEIKGQPARRNGFYAGGTSEVVGHSWHLYMLRLNMKTEDGRKRSEIGGQRSLDESSRSPVLGHQSPNPSGLSIDRARFMEELKSRNIGASVHFIPLHLHPYYRSTYGYKPEDFPVAYSEYLREVSLPIYSKMSDADVQNVIEAVVDIADKYQV